MSKSKTFTTSGIVLKRSNVGETDRIITFLSQDHGKITAVAKGVRKMKSSRRAALEPGNFIKGYFISTKSLPLLTQTTLIEDCSHVRDKLAKIRQLTQLLEILEKLFVEEELEASVFKQIMSIRSEIVSPQPLKMNIKQKIEDLIYSLGYQHPQDTDHASILDYVAALTDKPMRSFEYLLVKN